MRSTILITMTLITLFSVFTGTAQTEDMTKNKTSFAFEVDPMTFAFKGYAAHLRINPAPLEHWIFGIGLYGMNFPSPFVKMHKDNRNDDWNVRLKLGVGLFSEYYFNEERKGWFIGSQTALQKYQVGLPTFDTKEFTTIVVMPYSGYRWIPFNNGFYVQPWLGVGYTQKIAGSRTIGSKKYAILPIIPFMTFHIGYKF